MASTAFAGTLTPRYPDLSCRGSLEGLALAHGTARPHPPEGEPSANGGPDGEDLFETLSRDAEARNVNPVTLLATDYLNHFNEVLMLLELLPLAPDCAADLRGWAPKGYERHFLDSGFRDREFAVRAYAAAPAQYREPFDRTIAELDRQIALSVAECCALADAGDEVALQRAVERHLPQLRKLQERAGGLIHGYLDDAGIEGDPQASIDALFDD